MKQQVLDRLNEIIVEEKGIPVTMDSMWTDSELDSLKQQIKSRRMLMKH